MMKRFFVVFWYYYIPFIALAVNFIVPYEVNKAREATKSTMDSSYLDWVEKTINAGKGEDN